MNNEKLILLFSHKLTQEQKVDAKENWNIKEFIYLPKDLQIIWSNISPDIESLNELLKPLKSFVEENQNKSDVVLIQGDFGACYSMVNFCKSLDLTTIYATTKRDTKEFIEDGKTIKESIFKFKRFREYE